MASSTTFTKRSWRSNWRKWCTYTTMAGFFLAGGVEYSVILPTMWDYLQSMHGKEWLYGLSLSAFSISNLVTGPIYGVLFDRTHSTKLIILFANLFEIGGNFMYFAATSKYMILGSRFVVGVGAGGGAVIFGELALTTTKKERTTVFSIFLMIRQIGMIIGPACNLFLRVMNFKLGPFTMDKFTSPGAFMMLVWIVLEFMFLLLFFKLPRMSQSEDEKARDDVAEANTQQRQEQEVKAKGRQRQPPVTKETAGYNSSSNVELGGDKQLSISNSYKTQSTKDMFARSTTDMPGSSLASNTRNRLEKTPSESSPLLLKKSSSPSLNAAKEGVVHAAPEDTQPRQVKERVSWLCSKFMREEIIVLLMVLFITIYDQTVLETQLVPVVESLLHWTEEYTSIFYSVAGVEIVISFLTVALLSKKIGDRWLVLLGLLMESFGYFWLLGTVGNATADTPWVFWKLVIGSIPAIFGLPFFIAGASLYSKLLPNSVQGFGQGLRRSVGSLAAIIGPLWVGSTVSFGNYYLMYGVPSGLLVATALMVLITLPRLKNPT